MTKPLLILALCTLCAASLAAGETQLKLSTDPYPYCKGAIEGQLGAGVFFSGGGCRNTINFVNESVRLGRMFSEIHGSGLLRGNWEGLVEIFGAEVFNGPKTGFIGASLIGRYNFVQEQARLVPYFQLGGGGLFNDIYKDESQRIIGSGFEFILHTGFGMRWQLGRNCALFAEAEFKHISNANTASRNVGLNGFGGSVGFSHFF